MMQIKWRKLFLKTTVWLSAEIVLTLIGLDNVADYSEFMTQSRVLTQATAAFAHLITLV
ncbi:MAG: hypothetical protein F6K19_24680 [Cyanothece sp. SIO1E1]|nr:hypothetical protein [Cyanothece sp. SIO1E1]